MCEPWSKSSGESDVRVDDSVKWGGCVFLSSVIRQISKGIWHGNFSCARVNKDLMTVRSR